MFFRSFFCALVIGSFALARTAESPTEEISQSHVYATSEDSASDSDIRQKSSAEDYDRKCAVLWSWECVKYHVLDFFGANENDDVFNLTRDLSVARVGRETQEATHNGVAGLVERVDSFLHSHELRMKIPKELRESPLRELLPAALPVELRVPLATPETARSHGFLKKAALPFLLGLKLQAAVVAPMALALVALTTWKALTLALLSLVLSGALAAFKLITPKAVNYEVVHYPHSAPAVSEHPVATPYGRALPDAHEIAFRAYAPQSNFIRGLSKR